MKLRTLLEDLPSEIQKIKDLPHLPIGPDFVRASACGLPLSKGVIYVNPPGAQAFKKLEKAPVGTIAPAGKGKKFTAEVRELNIGDIESGQAYIQRSKLISMLEGPLSKVNEEAIVVNEQDGKLYVIDGNHRLAALKLRGETKVRAIVLPSRPKK